MENHEVHHRTGEHRDRYLRIEDMRGNGIGAKVGMSGIKEIDLDLHRENEIHSEVPFPRNHPNRGIREGIVRGI